MPKGDRLILKADPEDGTTPIANLLLEAVAMAKLSGLQKGAICHLWRMTYGWLDEKGSRKKECKISISDWMKALDSTKSRTSEALSGLSKKNIIIRRISDTWGGYYYKLNTNISQWNSNCLDFEKFYKLEGLPFTGTVAQNGTVPNNDNSSENDNSCLKRTGTVAQNGTEQLPKTEHHTILYKEILNKDKEMVDEVFLRLDKIRGYKTTKRNQEKKSIKNMLEKKYTLDQIISTWEMIKSDKFWDNKEVFMMTVESQIGAIIHGTHQNNDKSNDKTKSNNDTDKFINGKYSEIVKH